MDVVYFSHCSLLFAAALNWDAGVIPTGMEGLLTPPVSTTCKILRGF